VFTNRVASTKNLLTIKIYQSPTHSNHAVDHQMAVSRPKFGIGASALRKEDWAFITGQGQYTDDIAVERALHGFVLRSTQASARFKIHSIKAALASPGVHLILTGEDVVHLNALRTSFRPEDKNGNRIETRDIPILCKNTVVYAGDAIAFIVAETVRFAEDAAELIEVSFEPNKGVVDSKAALSLDTPLVWPELKSNKVYTYVLGEKTKVEQAFAHAAKITKIAFFNNRLVSNYLETRAAIGEWNEQERRYVLTLGSQGVHGIRNKLANKVFKIPESSIRVITRDVGGGFGPKAFAYREYALVLEAAKCLGRPVKWVGTRSEHFLTDAHGRDNHVTAEMAMDADGKFLALKVNLIANMGAYLSENALFVPELGVSMTTGLYDIPTIDVSIDFVYTNTCPVDAYRGAGRPEAAFLIERLVDECARDMQLKPDEIRSRNFIAPQNFPYTTLTGRTYDVGEFDGHLQMAKASSRWNEFDERLAASKHNGMIRGIGLSSYVEVCAFDGGEPAVVSLRVDGMVELRIGTQSNGQGHATAYAQMVSEKLNLDLDRIDVRQGDTDELPDGGGTGGSRSIPLGGVSTVKASADLALIIRKIASDELEAAFEDIEISNGFASIVGTDRKISFADIAKAAKRPQDLIVIGDVKQDEGTYPNGTHVCEVEIDPETGETKIVAYTAVDDFGVVVNPILLAGQIHGGLAQGIGQALLEGVTYAENGQLLTASFMDYAVPRARDLPDFAFQTRNVPSTTNALGIKGAGEAATIASTPAVINAVIDALWQAYGIGHIEMPATPLRIWEAIQTAKAHG
jgi:aerobic carbon-monoxide dehydrogenase large subunit